MVDQKNNGAKIKYTATKTIMQDVLNTDKYKKKLELKERLTQIFNDGEGKEVFTNLSSFPYNPKKLREVNNLIKRVNKDITSLSGVCQDSLVDELINKYHLTVPAANSKTLDLKQKFLLTKLQASVAKYENDRFLINEEKAKHTELVKAYEELKKTVFNRWRTDYQQLKKEATKSYDEHYKQLSKDMKKEEKGQNMSTVKLQEKFNALPEGVREIFEIKHEIDQVSSASYRISKGCNVLSMLTLKVLSQIVDSADNALNDKNRTTKEFNASLLNSGSNQEKRKVRLVANNDDIRDSVFESTALNMLFSNLPAFRDLREGKQLVTRGYNDSLFVTVKNYIKETGSKFEKSSMVLIAEILSDFIINFSRLLPDQLKSMKINTVKVEMFHNILKVLYYAMGEDYTQMMALVNTAWENPKKKDE